MLDSKSTLSYRSKGIDSIATCQTIHDNKNDPTITKQNCLFLDVANNSITGAAPQSFHTLASYTALQSLSLQNNTLRNNWCEQLFDEFDLLITPTLPYDPPLASGPLSAEVDGRPQPAANIGSFTMPFNMSMHPAASMRAGASSVGLPVGLQIVAPRHRDDLVLQASYAFERERPWHPLWPDPIFT